MYNGDHDLQKSDTQFRVKVRNSIGRIVDKKETSQLILSQIVPGREDMPTSEGADLNITTK